MSRDHSLDDFRGGANGATDDAEGAARSETGGEDEATEAASAPESEGDAAVTPAEPTHAWSPDGGACAACGDRAATRWRQDGGYVCPDCKEW